jgi:hypothetical protein
MSHKWARCDPDYHGYDAAICAQLQAIERGEHAPPPDAPAEGPGWLQKAANLAQAVVEHLAAGRPLVDDETAAGRLAICRECVHLDGDSCRLCGCHMPAKVRWAEQHCPINKW